MNKKIIFISLFAILLAITAGQVFLPNTRLTISSNLGLRGVMDDWWYTESVICSTETGCADVIFVVDTSGSMSDKISELYTEIGEFGYNIEAQGYDASFGIVTFVDNANFPYGTTLFPDPNVFADAMGDLSGAEGGWEKPVEASTEAINGYSPTWNDTCKHILIVLTDETESDGGNAALIALCASESVIVYLVSPSGHPMEPVCAATGGQWFDIESVSLDEVLDAVADDIAEYTHVTVIITNTSGGDLDDIEIALHPMPCITLDAPDSAIQNTGPLADGASDTIVWPITEVANCHGCGDCFWISVTADALMDSIQGCLFIENCDCPGINVNVIVPRRCGNYTACEVIVFQFEGCLPVEPTSIVLNIGGTLYYYPDRMVYNPSNQTLTFTPPTPFPEDVEFDFWVQDAHDISGCGLRYSQHCSMIIDRSPPFFDDAPTWSPACGSILTDDDSIHFSACVHDEGVGMTPIDGSLMLDEIDDLFSIFFAMYLELNGSILGSDSLFDLPGIPGLPGLGYDVIVLSNEVIIFPPAAYCDTIVDSSGTFYEGIPWPGFIIYRMICDNTLDLLGLCPDCSDCDWRVEFHARAGDIRSQLLNPDYLEFCFHFTDMIEESECGPNDTAVCCTYYFGTCEPPSAVILLSPNDGITAICSMDVVLEWLAPATGSNPIFYNVYVDGIAVAESISEVSFNVGEYYNYTDTTETHTWFVVAFNPCGEDTSDIWTFDIESCCVEALAEIGCPHPICYAFSSCDPQPVSFIVRDPYGTAIDHTQTYFTIDVFHILGGSDTYNITGADGATAWAGDTATILWHTYIDGDSVVISIDSTFTTTGCKTVFEP